MDLAPCCFPTTLLNHRKGKLWVGRLTLVLQIWQEAIILQTKKPI